MPSPTPTPIPNVDKEKRTVAFSIVVDPGRRVYVRRIDVAGNNKTRDEVIRREMRQLEGAYYDASKIQLSRRRIDRTQFFGEVTVETLPVEGNPDQVDVVYTVKEKPTGALLLGVGFSSVEKIALSASVTQSNVFGTGKYISANINSGSVNQVYSLSYMDPYYTVDGVSRGFDVYKRRTDASSLAVGPYVTDSLGGGVKFGYPVSEQISVDFGANIESVELEIFSNSPLSYLGFVNAFGTKYTYGSLQRRLVARHARQPDHHHRRHLPARLERARRRRPLSTTAWATSTSGTSRSRASFTLHLGGEIGYAAGYGDKPLPFFKNFFAGGPGSVRGYRSFSLGPHGRARQRDRRQPQARRHRRGAVPDAGRGAGPLAAPRRLHRRRPGLRQQDRARRAALRRRPCAVLVLAARAAAPVVRHAR